jgi:phenylacetic acid degradation operon negative regulatory protein
MVSLFGDLAREEGQRIDGPVLSAIMHRLQVKPEAVRVALHRLRNEGWIVSRKSGRISRHSLSDKGRRESAEASPRIYARPDAEEGWQVVLLEADTAEMQALMVGSGFTSVAPRFYVGPQDAQPPKGALAFDGQTAPEWLKEQAAPEPYRAAYAALADTLTRLQADLPDPGCLSPIEVAVLRCLIVHNWRRLVLKHPPLPPMLVAQDWPGHRCHRRVMELLDRFPRPALSDIELDLAA